MKLEEHFSQENSNLNPKDFKREFEDCLNNGELARLLLTIMREKPATDIEAFMPSEEKLQNLITKLNSAGFNCYVERNPEETMAESLSEMVGEDSEPSEMIQEAEITVRIFITEKKYSKKFFKPIVENSYGPKFHRRYGEFLEFEEENIEAFVYFMMPTWRKIIYRLKNSKTAEAIGPLEALEKYGKNTDTERRKTVSALSFGRIADTQKNFEKMMEKVESRRKAIEESELDLGFFLENLADPRIEMEGKEV